MKKIVLLMLLSLTVLLCANDNRHIYSEVTFYDYLHGDYNSSDITANKWDVLTGLHLHIKSLSLDLSTLSSLYEFYYSNINITSIPLELPNNNIVGNEDIHSFKLDLQHKFFTFNMTLGEITSFYGSGNIHLFNGVSLGLLAHYNSSNMVDLQLFDRYTLNFDYNTREIGGNITQEWGDFYWSINSTLLSISNEDYEDKIQMRYELSYIPNFSAELSYNKDPLLMSLSAQYSFLDPCEIKLYHDDLWFGAISMDEKSHLFNIETNLTLDKLQLTMMYDYFNLGKSRIQAESKVFIFGPIAYSKVIFNIPEVILQRVGGSLTWSHNGFTLSTTYNRYLTDRSEISWNIYDFIWLGLLPKLTSPATLGSYTTSYDHINTLDLHIGYERELFDRVTIGFNVNQLIPYFDSTYNTVQDGISPELTEETTNIDGGRIYSLNISMKI